MQQLIAATLALVPAVAGAQAFPATPTPIQLGTGTYTETFDGLASTGTTGTALPTGFQISETGSNAKLKATTRR